LKDVEAAHRRLEAAERAGKSSGMAQRQKRSLLDRLQDAVRPDSSSAGSPSVKPNGDVNPHEKGGDHHSNGKTRAAQSPRRHTS
jgi:hypothetical protein